MKAVNETYLGDGLYASFDGFVIWLRAPRKDGDHFVGLEPATFSELLQYAEQIGMLSRRRNPRGTL